MLGTNIIMKRDLHPDQLVREQSERSAGTADTDTWTRMTAAQRFMSNRYYG